MDNPAKESGKKERRSFSKGFWWFLFILLALFAGSSLLGRFLGGGEFNGREQIALVEVTGVIMDSGDIVRQLSNYRRDDEIKAIVLRVDSPGGGVAPSQEIYEEVLRIRADKKPIYTSMGSMAASGGYYIACATDRIYANPGTLTGSIGVIMAFTNATELIGKIGIKPEVIKSGKYKDIGSPTRPMTKSERRYMQKVSDDVHDQFITAVAKGRGLDKKNARKFADGRVFTGRQAQDYKLVDEMGGLEETIQQLAKAVGIQGRPRIVVERPEKSLLELLLGANVSESLETSLWPTQLPRLLYLWLP
ncbi:Peptidase S49, putative signal peptide peptidase SppA [Nitrospina gracilis 3/211]|uniref:Peptidase S49, putative signal peptide peptidase SppA n=1 Tax=Nitrospina gracilis (strain 3/211) TaxID=1266370 RepID=M1Z9I6_NITG3|nr:MULTISPECIES: signal peptide peptidase SppA [Nitrospina]MCF8722869.1 protease-4 [Nitrospina sp. Nb-3]CCQ89831.1 Peptidase S49, putative signal peptide peptidase SppA [Nitrospina gracilis 3/211]